MRRRRLLQGCAALALTAFGAPSAEAARTRAPRVTCTHTGCRHHRPAPDRVGLCGLALRGPAALPDEALP